MIVVGGASARFEKVTGYRLVHFAWLLEFLICWIGVVGVFL